MDAEIYLGRHGETEWNAQDRFQGCLDSPLTPNGREQARQWHAACPGVKWIIVTSPSTSVLSVAHVELRKSSGKYAPVAATIREPHPGSHDRFLGRAYA
jgi:broad specificity phosphatase PhoE